MPPLVPRLITGAFLITRAFSARSRGGGAGVLGCHMCCSDRHGDGAAVARIIFAREMKAQLTIALPVPPSAARLTKLAR